MNKVRETLTKRGSTTIRGLGIAFRCIDSVDKNRKADKEEFRTGLNDLGVKLAPGELEVRNYLWKNNTAENVTLYNRC